MIGNPWWQSNGRRPTSRLLHTNRMSTLRSTLLATALGAALLAGCTRIVDTFVYLPEGTLSASPGAVGLRYEEQRFTTDDGVELHGWWVPGTSVGPCILFFHGNAGNISGRLDILRLLHDRLGTDVFLFDYRGYGKSRGKASEQGLYADAAAARRHLRAKGWDRGGVILYGRSLGAAVALHSAVRDPPAGLVLEAPFTSLEDVARVHYPVLSQLVTPWLAGRFDNLAEIRNLSTPVLFLHGERDAVHPIGMAWRLYDAAPEPKGFLTVRGAGHDDPAFVGGDDYWRAWKQFLAALGASTSGGSGPGVREGAPEGPGGR